MSVREKLVALFHEAQSYAEETCSRTLCQDCPALEEIGAKCAGALAVDYMMAHGVALPVRCEDCKHFIQDPQVPSAYLCQRRMARRTYPDDYCNYGERGAENA